jgi:hypothetical protein
MSKKTPRVEYFLYQPADKPCGNDLQAVEKECQALLGEVDKLVRLVEGVGWVKD